MLFLGRSIKCSKCAPQKKKKTACEFEMTWEWVDKVWIFILWMIYYCLKSYAGMSRFWANVDCFKRCCFLPNGSYNRMKCRSVVEVWLWYSSPRWRLVQTPELCFTLFDRVFFASLLILFRNGAPLLHKSHFRVICKSFLLLFLCLCREILLDEAWN